MEKNNLIFFSNSSNDDLGPIRTFQSALGACVYTLQVQSSSVLKADWSKLKMTGLRNFTVGGPAKTVADKIESLVLISRGFSEISLETARKISSVFPGAIAPSGINKLIPKTKNTGKLD